MEKARRSLITFTRKKPMESSQKELTFGHFSHPHPLERTSSPSTGNVTCFGCKLMIMSGKDYYSCKTCGDFSLHYVCCNMPMIAHHPSHSRHDLVLLVPSKPGDTTESTPKCVACGQHVAAGFCYHCAECAIYYHTFCLVLPLSITISYHPHKIKLEFSPPYDFFCDLCKKPSYNGWLYRCNICEFDTHVACAIAGLEPQSFHLQSFSRSNTLLRQITVPQGAPERNNGRIGDSSNVGYEIMHLVAQQIGGGIIITKGMEEFGGAVAGWDKKLMLHSPREKSNKSNTGMTKIGDEETESSSPAENYSKNPEERTPLQDKLTSRSDMSLTPSYQFSDAYFSIDLAKSYSTHDQKILVAKQVGDQKGEDRGTSGQATEPFGLANWPSFNSYNMAQRETFLKEGHPHNFGELSQKAMKRKPDESLAKWSVSNPIITKSDSERYSSSGWRKFVPCCL